MKEYNKLIFELSREGRKAYTLPKCDVPECNSIPDEYKEKAMLFFPKSAKSMS